MANLNKVILIGRLTRDPESRSFPNGGKVSKFGFAVTNRKRNSQTGQWEDEPMFIDCEVYNRGEFGKQADLVSDRCRKGTQIMVEGRLHLDQWDDKTTGQKRSKHKIVVDNVQLLEPRPQGEGGGGYGGGGYSGGGGYGGGSPRGGGFTPPAADGPPDDDFGSGLGSSGGDSPDNKEIPF
jgi:single-strand DNA-binding protein